MGLPMWQVPSPEARKDTLKADPTASARSPIRRATVHPTRGIAPGAARRGRLTRGSRSQPQPPSQYLLSATRSSQHEATTRSVDGPRLPPPPVPESRNYARQQDSAGDTERREGDVLLRRTQQDRPGRSERPFWEIFGEIGALGRQLPAYTPNFAPAAAPPPAQASPPSLSRSRRSGYAPHRPTMESLAQDASRWRRGIPRSGNDDSALSEDHDDDNDDNTAVTLPPLRRMGRRSIADGPLPASSLRESWSPPASVDGLGDRERSFSPGDDHWDTFHSTVAPDPLAPTVDSSFTSAAASASFTNSNPASRAGSANSNSASSFHTHLTVPSRQDTPPSEQFMRACDTSEGESASDTEAEDEDEFDVAAARESARARVERLRGAERTAQRLRMGRNSAAANEDELELQGLRENVERAEERIRSIERMTDRLAAASTRALFGHHSTAQFPFGRPPGDQLDGPAEESTDGEDDRQTLDQEDARAILERLTRREDLSDEFWASVGLTRSMADRVERVQQRERL